jgi:hypothetical protein
MAGRVGREMDDRYSKKQTIRWLPPVELDLVEGLAPLLSPGGSPAYTTRHAPPNHATLGFFKIIMGFERFRGPQLFSLIISLVCFIATNQKRTRNVGVISADLPSWIFAAILTTTFPISLGLHFTHAPVCARYANRIRNLPLEITRNEWASSLFPRNRLP